MSGLEVVAFALTVYPLVVKGTVLALRLFDEYESEEDYQDKILALNIQRNVFFNWVQSRRFTSQRALQYRLRIAKNQEFVTEQYTLAWELILRILTVLMKEIKPLLRENKPPESIPKKSYQKGSIHHELKSSVATAASVAAAHSVIFALKLDNSTKNAPNNNESEDPLANYLKEAYPQIKDPATRSYIEGKLKSLREISPTNDSATSTSRFQRRVKDFFRAAVLDRERKLDSLIAKIKEWNEGLNRLFQVLVADEIDSIPSDHPHRLPFEAPFARNQSFIGREDILKKIEHHFDIELNYKVAILYGSGGYGKTQIALEYTYRAQRHYSSIIWIDARSVSTIKTSAEKFLVNQVMKKWPWAEKILHSSPRNNVYVLIAGILGIDIEYKETATFDSDALQKKISKDSLRILGDWLALQDNNRWLIMADNFDDPDEVEEGITVSEALNSLIPNNDVGHLIVITQTFKPDSLNLKGDAIHIEVGGFEKGNGVKLLGTLLEVDVGKLKDKNKTDYEAVEGIAKELKGHALYITLAGACIRTLLKRRVTPLSGSADRGNIENTIQDYYKEFKDFIDLDPQKHKNIKHHWVISYSFEKLSEPAQKLFGILSEFSQAEMIPPELFERCIRSRNNPPAWLEKLLVNKKLDGPLMELSSFHFINSSHDSNTPEIARGYNIHSKVQEWWLDYTPRLKPEDGRLANALHAYDFLSSSFILEAKRRVSSDWRYEQEILPHLEHAYETSRKITQNGVPFDSADLQTLYKFAQVFYHHSRYQKAEELYQRVLKALAQVDQEKDSDLPNILNVIDALVVTLRQLGKHPEALEWAERSYNRTFQPGGSVEPLSAAFGGTESTPADIQRITNLATCLEEEGKHEEALRKFQELEDYLQRSNQNSNQNSEHEMTIVETRISMAKNRFKLGQLKETIELLDKIQESWQSTDNAHPVILEARRAKAAYKLENGDYEEAMQEYENLIVHKKNLLGENHFSVLITIMESGYAYSNKGNLLKAQKCFETARAGYMTVFQDPNHPSLLHALRGMARVEERQWNYKESLHLYQEIMEVSVKRDSGVPEHYGAMNSVANCLFALGRYDEALKYYKKAEEYYAGKYDRAHIYTATISVGRADVHEARGEYREALRIYREVQEVKKKTYMRADHPSILSTVTKIGAMLERLGRYEDSEKEFQIAIAGLDKAYGESHSQTVVARQAYARLLESQRKFDEALKVLELVITERKKVNAESPWVYLALCSKARITGIHLKQYDAAMGIFDQSIASWEKTIGEDHPWALEAQHWKGRFLSKKKKYDEALSLLKGVSEKQKSKLGEQHPHTLQTMCVIAEVMTHTRDQKTLNEAREIVVAAVEGMKTALGEQHPLFTWAVERQEKVHRNLKNTGKWYRNLHSLAPKVSYSSTPIAPNTPTQTSPNVPDATTNSDTSNTANTPNTSSSNTPNSPNTVRTASIPNSPMTPPANA